MAVFRTRRKAAQDGGDLVRDVSSLRAKVERPDRHNRVVRATHLEDLVQLGTLTGQAVRFLEAAVASGLNILVSGGIRPGTPCWCHLG